MLLLLLLRVTAGAPQAGLLLDAAPAELWLVQAVLALAAVATHAAPAVAAARGVCLLPHAMAVTCGGVRVRVRVRG